MLRFALQQPPEPRTVSAIKHFMLEGFALATIPEATIHEYLTELAEEGDVVVHEKGVEKSYELTKEASDAVGKAVAMSRDTRKEIENRLLVYVERLIRVRG